MPNWSESTRASRCSPPQLNCSTRSGSRYVSAASRTLFLEALSTSPSPHWSSIISRETERQSCQRIHAVLRPGGRLVLADVVVPDDPQDAVTPLSPEYDHPSSVAEHLAWLKRAGFSATVVWSAHDLAVFSGERHP